MNIIANRQTFQQETASCKKSGAAGTPPTKVGTGVLHRSEFTTSRLAEFASKEELTRLIGHSPGDWPVAALKELVDNALDAAERAGVAPVIDIAVDGEKISVSDNGPGIATETIERTLDYAYRTSSNSAYVSPTRGQQGNALQTLLAMAHALTGKPGLTVIESRGVRHQITFDIDPISREPRLDHQRVSIPAAPGMKVTMFWGASLDEEQQIGLSNAAVDLSSTRTRT
jgi:DNA topoisomerase VI subunit B